MKVLSLVTGSLVAGFSLLPLPQTCLARDRAEVCRDDCTEALERRIDACDRFDDAVTADHCASAADTASDTCRKGCDSLEDY